MRAAQIASFKSFPLRTSGQRGSTEGKGAPNARAQALGYALPLPRLIASVLFRLEGPIAHAH